MVDACQIPEEVLYALSTEDLTDICLQYPLLTSIFAFNGLTDGLNVMYKDFNGIRELYKRADASNCLTKRYIRKSESFSFLNENKSDLEKGNFIISISSLEALLGQVVQYDNKNCKKILQCLVKAYEKKLKYADEFMWVGFETNCFARAHVISKMDKRFIEQLPGKDNSSALFSGMADERTIKIVNEWSYRLIK